MKKFLFAIFLFTYFSYTNPIKAQQNLPSYSTDVTKLSSTKSKIGGNLINSSIASVLQVSQSEGFASVTSLTPLPIHTNLASNPQSKVWTYDGKWWAVIPNGTGTYIWRLEGNTWIEALKIYTGSYAKADCKVVGNVAHIFLYRGSSNPSYLVSVEYDSAIANYNLWSKRSKLTGLTFESGVETASIDIDSNDRMWLVSDGTNQIYARWSDFPYTSWSTPISIANNVTNDDIAAVIAMPTSGSIGILWSDQNRKRFGFKTHVDGTDPTIWSTDEVPAAQSALDNNGAGMADDHLNVTIARDGTLYCAVKTGYKSGSPCIALLVRQPSGTWDNLYEVAKAGNRPIVIFNETTQKIKVVYAAVNAGGILYKESSNTNIAFGTEMRLINESCDYSTSSKDNYTSDIVILASTNKTAYGVLGNDEFSSRPADVIAPTVESINRQTPINETTSESSVIYRVTFSEKVSGVESSDFTIKTDSGTVTGTLTSDAVLAVGTTGTTYDITISSITGTGVLGLDLKAESTGIIDESGNALTTGFTNGQTYFIEQKDTNEEQYSLTITTTGSGTVTKSPDQATYVGGSNITLTATPATNYQFTGWRGDLSGTTNPVNITMTGNKAVEAIFSPLSDQQKLSSFTLVSAHTEQDIQTLEDGAIINLSSLPSTKLNIRANTLPSSVGSVKFELSGTQSKIYTDNAAPYALHGDDGSGNYYYGNWSPPATGTYTLKATPYSGSKASGTAGTPLTISFTFVNQNTAPVSSTSKVQKEADSEILQLGVYPNPFTTKAIVYFDLPETADFSLFLYDSKGAFVKDISQNGVGANEKNRIEIDGNKLFPGLYFLRLNTSNSTKTIKLMLSR